MTFSEVRPYQYGDDVRSIDWNVTAKYNEPFVKVFEEERELTLMLMVDISGSESFGTRQQFKRETITEITATLAFSAIQNNDKVGLILFSDTIELFIPPKKGKSHVLRIIRDLLEFEPKSHQTDIGQAMAFCSQVMKKKAIVFVLSDFMANGYEKQLKILANKHDVTGIRIYDRQEESLSNIGLVPLWDNETQETVWVDTSSYAVRRAYNMNYQKHVTTFNALFKKTGAGIVENRTDQDYVKNLLLYFKKS